MKCLVCARSEDDTFEKLSALHAPFCGSCAAQISKLTDPVLTMVVASLVTASNAPRERYSL